MNEFPVIEVFQRALSETRTPERSCAWEARCDVDGKTYVAVSRQGATHELARTLVNALTYDAAMVVRTEDRAGTLTVPSLRAWAHWTYSGDERVPWARVQANLAQLRGLRGGGCDG